MKRAVLILLMYVLGLPMSNAQKLLMSDKEDFNLRFDDFSVIGNFNQAIAVYRKRDSKVEIILYNKNMQKIKSIPLDFIDERYSQIFFSSQEESIQVFYQQKENKKENLYAVSINKDYTHTEPIQLQSLTAGVGLRDRLEYHRETSENGNYHVLYTSYYLDGAWVLQAVVVDNKLQEQNRISQLFSEKDWVIRDDVALSNAGTLFMVTTEKPSSKGSTDEIKILTSKIHSNQFISYPIALNKHTVSDLHFVMDNTNTMAYLCGFYSDGKYSTPRGIYYTAFDEETQLAPMSHFVSLALQVSSTRDDLKDLTLRNISIKKDGGIELIAEKYYQNVRTISAPNPVMNIGMMSMPDNSRTINEYYYDEAVFFNIKPDGTLAWSQTMLKEQQTNDDAGIYSSIGVLEHKLGKVILFNDVNSRQPRLMTCYISSNSELSMKELQTSEEMNEWNWMPRSSKQLSKSEIVVPCIMKSYLCFLKISF